MQIMKREYSPMEMIEAYFMGFKDGYDEAEFQAAFLALRKRFKKFAAPTEEEIKELWEELYGSESSNAGAN